MPAPIRPLAKHLISTMLDDDRLTAALGLPHSTRSARAGLQTGLKIRNFIHRRRPLKTEPHFTPGKAGSTLYPTGYSLDQIGPINVPRSPVPTGNELP